MIDVTWEMIDAFGDGWKEVDDTAAAVPAGSRRRAGLAKAMPVIEEAFRAQQGPKTSTTRESRGRIAYTAYGRSVGWQNFLGQPMPQFDQLPAHIREAWIVSANVVWDLATTGHATL